MWAVFRRETVKNIRFCDKLKTAEDLAFAVEAYTNAQNVFVYRRADLLLLSRAGESYRERNCNFDINTIL
ncbi:MAG: hypothetical protein L6V93_09440 [Clostridiales bacterium]|nr:MAG: hypothetical protein L6V93_09440 [Clostridiales bacterium]